MFARGPFLLQSRQLGGQRDDFLVELLLGIEPIPAGIGIDAEIADHRGRHRVEGKPGEYGFQSVARNHGPEHGTVRLTES